MSQVPSWDEYFMKMAALAASRSKCLRRKVGAVLVKENHILATGYNGPPRGFPHCKVCYRQQHNIPSGERHELCFGLHAEQNAIIQAARFGVSVHDSALYCTDSPCAICAKMIVNAGISRIVFANNYPDKMAKTILETCGVELLVFEVG